MPIVTKSKQFNIRIKPDLLERIEVVLVDYEGSNTHWLTELIEKDVRRREKALKIPAPKLKRGVPRKAKASKYEF